MEKFSSEKLAAAKERPLAKSNETDREAAAGSAADRPFPELASALRSQANQIVEAWAGAVRAAIPPATDLPSDELQDHLPAILRKIADAMDALARRDVDEPTRHSPATQLTHLQPRYDVRALMTEDRLLRRVIIERVKVALDREMTPPERVALATGVDTMLEEAVRAQDGWADRPGGPWEHRTVVIPSSEAVGAASAAGDERAGETSPAVLHDTDGTFPPVVRVAAVTAFRQSKSPQGAAAVNAAHLNEGPVLPAAAAFPEISFEITHETIAVAAYYIWENKGRRDGSALEDWLQAEVQLTAKHPRGCPLNRFHEE